ncbi:uncharacterized protein LOC111615349, partial [Centruroides sculpturatus]|uniref:uncharacterized protein LOC111615349 n=1 Tax=Centruroides sculpturatus TaxID=218467 RepID=UPI000C6CB7BC
FTFILRKKAFKGYVRSYRAFISNYTDPSILFENVRHTIYNILTNDDLISRMKFLLNLKIKFIKYSENETITYQDVFFSSRVEHILSRYMIDERLTNAFDTILNFIDQFIKNGSGWIIKEIIFLDIHLGIYKAESGGCGNIILPKHLINKRCLLNIKCSDNQCFLYCVIASLYPNTNNKNSIYSYRKFLKYLNTNTLKFPVNIKNIPSFEKNNSLKIQVFGYEKKIIYPIYISKYQFEKEINLLLYKSHYFLIRNFNRLLSEKSGIRKFCKRCLIGFQRSHTLNEHVKICSNYKYQKVSTPTGERAVAKFTNYEKQLYHPIVIYADFESILEEVDVNAVDLNSSFTKTIQIHKPICYSIVIIENDDDLFYSNFYCGKDAVKHFLFDIQNQLKFLLDKINSYVEMNVDTIPDNYEHRCHICEEGFNYDDIRVRDHDHLTGDFRGIAHNHCNLNYRFKKFIPIILHNFTGYDSHLIFKNIPPKLFSRIQIIPVNSEKFTTFTLDHFKFIDSFQFLNSSLTTLTENLKNANYNFPIFNQFFYNNENKNLLKRKGIFPYSYFKNEDILYEKCLPPKKYFYNELSGENISDDDYDHAKLVWKKFRCKNFKDYLKLYQYVDTLLLADIFQNFRKLSLKYYNLDPVYFITAPDLTWNCGLKMTKIQLELFKDINMYLFIEQAIRGGISLTSKRFARANNPLIPETYDKNQRHNYIISIDANNLYGFVMSSYLPVNNFRWLSEDEINALDICNIPDRNNIGYILEVDLNYPPNVHDRHNDLPLAPNHTYIPFDLLSNYQKSVLTKLNLKYNNNNKKLIPTLFDKQNYVIHYRNLKFYLEEGLILTKIHRVLAFNQEPWLRDYVLFNNKKRQESTNDFDKSFFKLMNNSFFGKTCQNVRKRLNLKTAMTENQCRKYLSHSALENFQIINNNLTIFQMKKINLCSDKPIYIGFCVLELSKLHMYQTFYKIFKNKYGENVDLLYTDTDSLMLQIYTNNLYNDFKSYPDIFDLSNYPNMRELFDVTNKNKLGYFKDETASKPIIEFCSL